MTVGEYNRLVRSIRISIHTPLAGSDSKESTDGALWGISIHTPLAGSDITDPGELKRVAQISIHTPLAGSDLVIATIYVQRCRFQSTLPSRGVTVTYAPFPHIPPISIHTPLAGSDDVQAALVFLD